MAKKLDDEQQKKQQARKEWAEAYNRFNTEKKEELRPAVLDDRSAVSIVTRGVGLGRTGLVKGLDWLLIADVFLMAALLLMGLWELSEKLSNRMLSIDLISFGWFMVDVIGRSVQIDRDYSLNIAPAVERFGIKSFSEKVYKQGLTNKLFYFANEEEKTVKTKELKADLSKKIVSRISLAMILMWVGAAMLLGMVIYMDRVRAFAFAFIGMIAGLVTLIVLYMILKNR